MATKPAVLLLALLAAQQVARTAAAHDDGHPNYNNYNYNYNNDNNDIPGVGGGDPGAFFAGVPWFGGAQAQARAGGGGGGGGGGAAGGGGGGGGAGFFGAWGEGGLGYRRGAVVPPSTVCPQDGPCRGKRLTCPQHCFRTFSYGDKNGAGGGGGGGCSFDCTRCAATC